MMDIRCSLFFVIFGQSCLSCMIMFLMHSSSLTTKLVYVGNFMVISFSCCVVFCCILSKYGIKVFIIMSSVVIAFALLVLLFRSRGFIPFPPSCLERIACEHEG
jgi:hypothetical protein